MVIKGLYNSYIIELIAVILYINYINRIQQFMKRDGIY